MGRSDSTRWARTSRDCASLLVSLGLFAFGLGPVSRTASARPAELTLVAVGPAPVLSGNLPLTVVIPSSVESPEEARPFFDSFSWQSFIALSWPASPTERGAPERPNDSGAFLASPAGAHPVVWGTYKEDYELFDQLDRRPSPWESTEVAVDPCSDAEAGDKVFVRYGKGDSVVEEGNQAFSFPLIDQSKQYAVYEVRFNKAQYNFVRGADSAPTSWLYLARNLAAKEPVSMPASKPPATEGALMIKAAWKIIDPERDDENRFYHLDAFVLDPADGKCKEHTVGLIGLHVVQKLAAFPQWIWSSFEQVDNVPAEPGPVSYGSTDTGPARSYSFNNGTADPPTQGGWANRPPAQAPDLQPIEERVPVQVTRLNPIPASTKKLNEAVQQGILKDTVWRHYQLIITQWPSSPDVFKSIEDGGVYPRDAGGAFPANGATNAVMETYLQWAQDAQGAGGNSCMSCHYRADQADFSWTLMRGAH